MSLKRITLELARNDEFPDGSVSRGYQFYAPLTADGHIDLDDWPNQKQHCRVRRFWADEPERIGELHHTRHRTWAFSYEPGEADDEPVYRLEGHVFKPGEYVTVTEQTGEVYTFKVVEVREIAGPR